MSFSSKILTLLSLSASIAFSMFSNLITTIASSVLLLTNAYKYSRLMPFSSNTDNVEFNQLGSSGTARIITSFSFTIKPSFSRASIAFSLSETINLKIPYLLVSAIERARILMFDLPNVSIAFLILPSLFSTKIEICFTAMLSPLKVPFIDYANSFTFTSWKCFRFTNSYVYPNSCLRSD